MTWTIHSLMVPTEIPYIPVFHLQHYHFWQTHTLYTVCCWEKIIHSKTHMNSISSMFCTSSGVGGESRAGSQQYKKSTTLLLRHYDNVHCLVNSLNETDHIFSGADLLIMSSNTDLPHVIHRTLHVWLEDRRNQLVDVVYGTAQETTLKDWPAPIGPIQIKSVLLQAVKQRHACSPGLVSSFQPYGWSALPVTVWQICIKITEIQGRGVGSECKVWIFSNRRSPSLEKPQSVSSSTILTFT